MKIDWDWLYFTIVYEYNTGGKCRDSWWCSWDDYKWQVGI